MRRRVEAALGEPLDGYLRRRYVEDQVGATTIARDLDVSYPTVRAWLLKAGVPLRSPVEWAALKSGAANPMFAACKTPEHREKLRDAQLRRYAAKGNPLAGRSLSDQHRARIIANAASGSKHPCYKGGWTNPEGYRLVSIGGRRRYEHRVVMEQAIGRTLRRDEHVHHRNGDRLDNRPENLQILSNEEHKRLHWGEGSHELAMRLSGKRVIRRRE